MVLRYLLGIIVCLRILLKVGASIHCTSQAHPKHYGPIRNRWEVKLRDARPGLVSPSLAPDPASLKVVKLHTEGYLTISTTGIKRE